MKPCLYKIAEDFSRSKENVSADEGKGRFAKVNCLTRINFLTLALSFCMYNVHVLISRSALLLVVLQAVSALPEPEAGLNVNHLPLLSR
jgi:hypothetical protein